MKTARFEIRSSESYRKQVERFIEKHSITISEFFINAGKEMMAKDPDFVMTFSVNPTGEQSVSGPAA